MKRAVIVILILSLLCSGAWALTPVPEETLSLPVEAAVLMEKSSGEIIYEKNADQRLPPASVTKVMTMLLVAEAIDSGKLSLEDTVTGSANARSMGGSQIWLEDGEQMSVQEMLKCVAVVSANDCAVALAEHLAGSEEAFVAQMNVRAAELGCQNTNFCNCTGLFDDDDHYTSARDLAILSRELLKHSWIRQYTTIWIDSIRNGEFGLSNTNKLIRYYNGATGLKTGYTSKAGHCLAASAERNGTEYIAVVLHGENSNDRFEAAKTLLNYGFANYTVVPLRPETALAPIPVTLGTADAVQPVCAGEESMLLEKNRAAGLQYDLQLADTLTAPVKAGEKLGELTVSAGDSVLARVDIVAECSIARMSAWQVFASLFRHMVGKE